MAKTTTKKRRYLIAGAIGASILAVAAMAAIFGKNEKSITVTVERVGRRTITQTVSATGKIQPEVLVKISSEVSGEIIYLPVKEGDTVRKGDLLARIQPDLVQAQLEQARYAAEAAKAQINTVRAEYERAKLEFERIKNLYEKQFVSKGEYDQAYAALQSAQARLEASQKDYERSQAVVRQSTVTTGRTTIYAPINGIVVALPVEKGEKVLGTQQFQGTEMMQIADLSVMNAEVDVDENDVVMISVGDTARVRIDAFPNRVFRGYVYQIGNSAKRSAAGTQEEVVNFAIKIRLIDTDPRLRPGMSCDVDIETETRMNVLAVPLQSVTLRKPQEKENDAVQLAGGTEKQESAKKNAAQSNAPPPQVVFLKDGNRAKMVRVETGISDGGYIEIVNGLQEGQTVISGNFRAISKELEDGMLITVDSLGAKKFKKK
ncbi:MAG: efflux RND transporter periplasmic adaptor subunit [Bacteroidota bacterium]|nr:efflux RND transporter periplasmic adaptor subunit [Candidatus Kapabacteria bacterium]MDW8219500.1 efflux RND transporter periplasmic adaptor subunit [Bacteroidota bacterium]